MTTIVPHRTDKDALEDKIPGDEIEIELPDRTLKCHIIEVEGHD